jgi:hypothetical protein
MPKVRILLTRWRRMSAANSGPNLFHQCRAASSQDVDTELEMQILDNPQAERRAHIKHATRRIT